MSHPTPHRTPLRRVSQGSLHALSRSSNFPDAPHGLGFLTPVLAEFVDEMQTLQVNAEGIIALEKSLTKFNESFASWLYVQNMASLTLDWTQVSSIAIGLSIL
jgi:DASH complex subunit DAM1